MFFKKVNCLPFIPLKRFGERLPELGRRLQALCLRVSMHLEADQQHSVLCHKATDSTALEGVTIANLLFDERMDYVTQSSRWMDDDPLEGEKSRLCLLCSKKHSLGTPSEILLDTKS